MKASLALVALALAVCVPASRAQAQGRFLGQEEIVLYGLGLEVQPAHQTVPKGFATIVSTYLKTPQVTGTLPPFAPDAEVRATLRGPSFETPLELVARPNSPLNVPILTVPGTHTVENIRLVSGGEVLLHASPESVRIDVIEKLLVTSVTARALTAEEIREKGIVFDKSNFQAYNFTAAFAISDGTRIDVSFPVVLPTIETPSNVDVSSAGLTLIEPPMLRDIGTIIPDTLRIQSRIPNLSVKGFTLTLVGTGGSQDFYVPPIPGVIVIPGDIGFLNQYFSVMLLVANVAPTGSNLVVGNLSAAIVLPAGADNVVGSSDDPLAMAQTSSGESARTRAVAQAGADGKLGTGDDVTTLGPGETGSAEYLIEGRREGTWPVEMEITGTLTGMPVGPVTVRGRAAGSVLVRNPNFTLTFTHPDVVNAGEPYTLDVTVTNTSESPANFVSVNLFSQYVSGARLNDEPTKTIDDIAAGDSATVTFRLISQRTGSVTAATLDSDDNVAGRFALKTGVGEFGIPLSPDSLVLPKEAGSLPTALRDAALGLLGRAFAAATAPPAVFPKELTRFSKQVVLDRAVEVAEAGFRVSLGESLPMSAANLLMDFLGSEYARLGDKVPANDTTGRLALLQDDVRGFDLLRRLSVRGDILAEQIGAVLQPAAGADPIAFHNSLAGQFTSRPGHLSVFVSTTSGGPLPVDAVLTDSAGLTLGALDLTKVVKQIPFGDALTMTSAGVATGTLLVVAVPAAGQFTVQLTRHAAADPAATYSVSAAFPGADGRLRFVSFADLGATEVPRLQQAADDPYRIAFALAGSSAPAPRAGAPSEVVDPAPTVLGAVQMAEADLVGCPQQDSLVRWHGGRVVAVLFSEEVTAASVQDKLAAEAITAFSVPGNRVVSVALQPGHRIAYVALREPVGPFVERAITVQGVADTGGQVLASATAPIAMTVTTEGGVVSGRVLNADGTAAAFAEVRLFYEFKCDEEPVVLGMASEVSDAGGNYTFDYALLPPTLKLVALDSTTDDIRVLRFKVSRNSQRLNVNVVFIGRGSFAGRTLDESGIPLAGSAIRVTSLTDQSQYGTTSDALGRFEIQRVPVGNIVVEAVNTGHPSQTVVSERIPAAGSTVTRDLTLISLDMTGVTTKYGQLAGHVMRADNVTPVEGVPVVAYYQNRSQTGVRCPPPPPPFNTTGEPAECAIAMATTDRNGAFSFPNVTAGVLRVYSFDQAALQEGQVRITLAEDQTIDFSLLLGGGVGAVRGVVLDQDGRPVTDAEVGGGLSIAKVNAADGTFTLTDVPVGRREIVAASQAMGSTGRMTVDIVRQGEVVNATIVLEIVGAVAGRVFDHAGVPQAGITVNVIQDCFDEAGNDAVCIVGRTTTDTNGAYRVNALQAGKYRVSAFRSTMRDGNIVPFVIRYHGQVLSVDITFRGGGGSVTGRVLRAKPTGCVDGDPTCVETPLAAKVAVSGDRLVIGGGTIGVRFDYVQNYDIVDNDPTTGEFAFSNLWAGPFTVRAAGQFSPEPVAVEGEIASPGQTVNVDLRLQPTSVLTGTVYEPDGVTPVTGRPVTLTFTSNAVIVFCSEDASTFQTNCVSIPQGIQEMFAVTNESTGQFTFPIVNAGAFTITATDGSRVAELKGAVKAGETVDLGIRLMARGRVTVKVFQHDGQTPVTNASVHLQQIGYPKAEMSGVAVDGTIAWDPVGEGQFVVTAMDSNGFTNGGRGSGRILHDGDDITVNVYLYDATGTVAGLVTRLDDAGAPVVVSNAEVVLNNSAGPIGFAVTGASGQYSMSVVPVGTFTVDAFDPLTAGRGRASGEVTGGNQDISADIRLEALGVIRGVLIETGTLAPLKGWQVTLSQSTPSGRGLPTLTTTTSVDGSFSFPGASVGSFGLRAEKRGVVGTGTASGQVSRSGQLVEVQVVVTVVRRVTGSVSGLVATPTGSPAATAQVEICSVEGCRPTSSGQDGRFSLGDVPLGRFTVRASAQVTGAPSVGTAGGTLLFEDDVADVTVTLLSLGAVQGTVYEVVNGTRAPAAGARVSLYGQPGSGCSGACVQSADENGRFGFVNVPARTFTVAASNGVGQTLRQGSVGGVLNAGETKSGLEVVLEPAVGVSGRVRLASGAAAEGIVAALTSAGATLYAESGADGAFTFQAVKSGAYALELKDPIGPGVAKKSGAIDVSAAVDLGDITLDETPPAVGQITPADGSIAVGLTPEIRVTFTEPVNRATINGSTVVLAGPTGTVTGELTVPDGFSDTVAVFRPLGASRLASQSRYSVRVSGVEDLLGKKMVGQTTATFTTVDTTVPSILETAPVAGTTGVSIDTVVRVKYSEIVDPTRFTGPAIVVTGPSGAVTGSIDYILAGTVAVFTPTRPLAMDATYSVDVAAATDLGGLQSSAMAFTFSTTDGTPPQVVALTASNGGHVIENTTSVVTAAVGAGDVAFVDFFINGTFVHTDRAAPFAMTFQALPAYGAAGGTITMSAVATDTSGNRGMLVSTGVTVDADLAPAAVIVSPILGATVTNNQSVQVGVRGTDDVGVTRLAFKAVMGSTVLAALGNTVSASRDTTATFAFTVPNGAAPGAPIVIDASVADSKGQAAAATPVTLTVVDTTGPAASISSPFPGTRVRQGQSVTAVVTAEDAGGVALVGFRAVGITTETQRAVSPARTPVVTSFTFMVPASATAGSQVELRAFAVDATGNRTDAGAVSVFVADAVKPAVALRTETGTADMVRGRTVKIIVSGTDNLSVTGLTLTGTGAFAYSNTVSITDTVQAASHTFTLDVPGTVADGATEVLTARATDWSGNQSTPVTLTLTARPIVDVALPGSLHLAAGTSATITVDLAAPAAAPVTVQLRSASPGVATVTPSVSFAIGESTKSAVVTGISGGNAQIDAYVSNVQRDSMIVTVRGGIVHGTVTDGNLEPVSGAQVTIFHNGMPIATATAADGTFDVEGVVGYGGGNGFTVQATQGDRLGRDDAQLDVPNGSATVTVVILPLSIIHGTVYQSDGSTGVSGGVQVDLYDSTQPSLVLHTVWTDDSGGYEFRLVAPGSYVLVASDVDGNRGRATTAVTGGGQDVTANVTFLGKGTVTGLVKSGAGAPVGNASVELRSTSMFGQVTMTATSGSDGSFRFEEVSVGGFSVTAGDPATDQAGSTSGAISTPGQTVDVVVQLSKYGNLQGTVYRSDGATTVPGATVTVSVSGHSASTTTDTLGRYAFSYLPFAQTFVVTVNDAASRAIGRSVGGFTTSGETVTTDVALKPQGTLIVTVVSSAGVRLNDASVSVKVQDGELSDTMTGQTSQVNGEDGQLVLTKLMAGAFTATSSKSGLSGANTGTVVADSQTPVTIQLEPPPPTGVIAGTVLDGDGASPAAGAVRASGSGHTYTAPILTDGTFTLAGVRLGTYRLDAFDANGRLRAFAAGVVLASDGQLERRDLVFVGLGTVSGFVTNPYGLASGLTVSVRSLNASFGGYHSATTGAAGEYEVSGVPVGSVMVSTSSGASLRAEAGGKIDSHGQVVTVNLVLEANTFTSSRVAYDANDSSYTLQPSGTVFNGGVRDIFSDGAARLDIVRDGASVQFTGGGYGTLEEGGRETVSRQADLHGLSVTRKFFVPENGYFARVLETLTNNSAADVTVDVVVTSRMSPSLNQSGALFTRATSTGDVAIQAGQAGVNDHWIVMDDWGNDVDPYAATGYAVPLAFVFDGEGAPRPVSTVSVPEAGNQVDYQWRGLTVPAGGTVTLMHFVAEQVNRHAAGESGRRLVALPPEALAGLEPIELASIANFTLPEGGVSALAPLPELTGTVGGTVFEGDGVTPVPAAVVSFRSLLPLFGRVWSTTADAAGRYSLVGAPRRPVPLGGVELRALHPTRGWYSPFFNPTFPAGETSLAQDIVFSGTGVLAGTVRRSGGALVTSGAVTVTQATVTVASVPIGADGAYSVGALAPGAYAVSAALTHPQGTGLVSLPATGTVEAGQVTVTDLTIEPAGQLQGIVYDASHLPVASTRIEWYRLNPSGGYTFYRSDDTDALGRFTSDDMPVGSFTLRTYAPPTNLPVTTALTIVADTVAQPVLQYPAPGTLTVHVQRASGLPLQGVRTDVFGDGWDDSAGFLSTDAAGNAVFHGLRIGEPISVLAFDPAHSYLWVEGKVTLTAAGGGVGALTVTMPAFGNVTGTVYQSDGTTVMPGTKAQVTINWSGQSKYVTTDGNSRFAFDGIPAGVPLTVRVTDLRTSPNFSREVAGPIPADGETLSLDPLRVAAVAKVIVIAKNPDGTPITSADVRLKDTYYTTYCSGNPGTPAVTGADGKREFAKVPEGPFQVGLLASGVVPTCSSDGYYDKYLEMVAGQVTQAGGEVTVNIVPKTYSGVTITGVLAAADGATPVPGWDQVLIYRANERSTLLGQLTTDADGRFTLTNKTVTGAGVAVLVRSPGGTGNLPFVVVPMPESGGTVLDVGTLTTPVRRATVTGRLLAADGTTPITGYETAYQYTITNDNYLASASVATGAYAFPERWLALEGARVRVYVSGVPGGVVTASTGPITSNGQAITLDLILPPSVHATVSGQVVAAGDATTPLDGVGVELIGSAGVGLTDATTDRNGRFSLAAALPADGIFKVRAHSPSNWDTVADFDGQATSQAQQIDIGALGLNVSVVTGAVTYDDGQPVVSTSVFSLLQDNSTQYASVGSGRYWLYGLPAGAVTLTAQDEETGLTTSRTVTVDSATSVVTADLRMPPTGTVVATIVDDNGATVTDATMALVSDHLYFEPRVGPYESVQPNGEGQYVFARVPVGSVYLQASRSGCGGNCQLFASAGGELEQPGGTLTLQLGLRGYGTVTGRLLDAGGVPITGQALTVEISAFGSSGPLGNFTGQVSRPAGGDGRYTFDSVPPGRVQVRVSVDGADEVGVADGVVAVSPNPQEPTVLTLDVRLGTATKPVDWNGVPLDGGDGFRYSIDGSGRINGSLTSGELSGTLSNAVTFGFGQGSVWGPEMVRPDLEGRQLVVGPMVGGSGILHVTRKVYVPADGRFARHIDVVTNPATVPVTTEIQITSEANGDRLELSQPSTTAAGFARFAGGACGWSGTCGPTAYVFSGANPTNQATRAWQQQWGMHSQQMGYAWTVTVPPTSSLALLHFVAMDLPGNEAALGERAARLAALVEPGALDGLTDDDLAMVVNFRDAGMRRVNLLGTLLAADGVTEVPNGTVEVYQELGDKHLVTLTSANDGSGAFTANDLAVRGPALLLRTPGASGATLEMRVPVHDNGDLPASFVTDWMYASVRAIVLTSDGSGGVEGGFRVQLLAMNDRPLGEVTLAEDSTFGFGPWFMPAEGMKVRVFIPGLPGGFAEAQTGPVTESGQEVHPDITLPASIYAIFHGRVRAVGHDEGVETSPVYLVRADTREVIAQTTAGRDGVFHFSAALPVDGGYVVRVASPTNGNITVETTGTAVGQRAWIEGAEFALPISTAVGTLYDATGLGVAGPTIFAVSQDGLTTFATVARANGSFAFYGLPPGTYRLIGQDPATGITTPFSPGFTLDTDTSNVWYLDWNLPQTGTVVVHAVDEAGQPVNDATVALMADQLAFERRVGSGEVVTPANGEYTFEKVPLGSFYLQGKWVKCPTPGTCRDRFASAAGYLDSTTEPLGRVVSFSGYGTVEVNVIFPTTGTTMIGLDAMGSAGPLGAYNVAVAGAFTSFTFDLVPPGPLRAGMRQDGDAGTDEGWLEPGGSTTIGIYKNNAWDFDEGLATLDDAAGFRYTIQGGGDLASGGTTGGALAGTFTGGPTLFVGEDQPCCGWAGRWELDWRELVFGPMVSSARGLWATRRAYVSPATEGPGFVRYLDTIGNPTDADMTVTIGVRPVIPGGEGITREVASLVNPGATTGGYAVIAGVDGVYGASTYVYSGANPPVLPTLASFDLTRTDVARYEWKVVIPAHGRVALVHFVAQRAAGDTAGATTVAQALAGQVESTALAGLTEADLAPIINFALPGQHAVAVQGSLVASDGTTPLPGHIVEVIEALGGTVAGSTWTDDSGHYSVEGLAVRAPVKVRAHVAGMPSGYLEVEAGGLTSETQQFVVNLTLPPSVWANVSGRIQATDGASTDSIEGAQVSIVRPGASGEVLVHTTTDLDGVFMTSVALPADGKFILRAESPTGSGSSVSMDLAAPLVQGTTVNDNLDLPISVVSGRITDADGGPVAAPTIIARHTDGTATLASVVRDSGSYAFYELGAGTYTLVAQQPSTGLTATRSEDLTLATDTSVATSIDWSLPQTGTVVVTLDAGTPAGSATVALVSDGLDFERRVGPGEVVKPEADGRYVFNAVPFGTFHVQGKSSATDTHGNTRDLYASAPGVVSSRIFPAEAALDFNAHGFVQVDVVNPDAGPTTFLLDALGSSGPLGSWFMAVEQAATSFTFDYVPPGPVRSVVRQGSRVGIASGLLGTTPGTSGRPEVTVSTDLSNGVEFVSSGGGPGVVDNWGSDQYHYPIDGFGRIVHGGLGDDLQVRGTLHDAAALAIDGAPVCCAMAAVSNPGLGGDLLTLGPMTTNGGKGVTATRKVWVPDSGGSVTGDSDGFAQILDVFHNPTAVTVTVTVRLTSTIDGAQEGVRGVVERSADLATDGGFAILGGDSEGTTYGSSAYVFSGVTPALAPSIASFDFKRTGVARTEWKLTLAPGEKKALLHFVVQRAAGDTAGALARARALAADVAHAGNTLVGLTAEEKQMIVNFVIRQ